MSNNEQVLMDAIYDIREKITDLEYKRLMDACMNLHNDIVTTTTITTTNIGRYPRPRYTIEERINNQEQRQRRPRWYNEPY